MKKEKDDLSLLQIVLNSPIHLSRLFNTSVRATIGELMEQSAYAKATMETIPYPLLVLDSNLRVKVSNKAFWDTFQVSGKEVNGKYFDELVQDSLGVTKIKKALKAVLTKNTFLENFRVEQNIAKKGKKEMLWNARRMTFVGKKTKFILLTMQDVIKDTPIQEPYLPVNKEDKEIWNAIPDGVIIFDKDLRYLFVNDTAAKYIGKEKEEILGKTVCDLFPDLKGSLYEKRYKRALKKKKSCTFEEYFEPKKRWYEQTIYPIQDGALVFFRDATVRKNAESKKDEFLGVASHELKTPLTTIKTYSQILKKRLEENKDKKNTYFITQIENQTNKTIYLINVLLDVEKIQEGKFDIERKRLSINKLVYEVMVNYQFVNDTHEIVSIEDGKEPMVIGDYTRLSQVLTNLINNAIKYSKEGSKIVVSVKTGKKDVVISVKDEGIGIAKESISKVFDPYFQEKRMSSNPKGGFGLGLYVASEVVKKHKGKMWVKSKKNKGSTFYFSIPIAPEESKAGVSSKKKASQ